MSLSNVPAGKNIPDEIAGSLIKHAKRYAQEKGYSTITKESLAKQLKEMKPTLDDLRTQQ